MIQLTRLNGQQVIINALLIELIEETPDTLLTLTTGRKIMVHENASEVVHSVQTYLRELGTIRVAIKSGKMEDS